MVEQVPDDLNLDAVFQALAHPIRRAVLEEAANGSQECR